MRNQTYFIMVTTLTLSMIVSAGRVGVAVAAAPDAADGDTATREATFERKKKEVVAAVLGEMALPGVGALYAEDYPVGIGLMSVGFVALGASMVGFFTWASCKIDNDMAAFDDRPTRPCSSTMFWVGMGAQVGVRIVGAFIAARDVESYNARLRQRLGLTAHLDLQPTVNAPGGTLGLRLVF